MNFMSKLQTIESKIENLTKFQKIELYLIPLLFSLLLFFLFSSTSNYFEIENIQNRIETIKNRKQDKSHVTFIKEYTDFIKKNEIFLKSIDIKDKEIFLAVKANRNKLLKLLFFIETHNDFAMLRFIKIAKNDDGFELNIYISYENFYLKNRDFDFEKNVAFLESKKLMVDSIIADFISVDNRWLSNGDYLGKDKIKNIADGFVIFENGKKLKVVKNGKTQ